MTEEKIISIINSCDVSLCGVIPFEEALLLPKGSSRKQVPESSKSVIVCLFPYFTGEDEKRNVSRYAISKDYHIIVKKYLDDICHSLKTEFPDFSFVSYTDSSPLKEVLCACKAGLGKMGLNNTLINDIYGSYVFIGEIVTDMVIECESREVVTCKNCGKCTSACPSGALTCNGVDIARCISHISQKKGELTSQELKIFSKTDLVWGCDVCQEVCPHNKSVKLTDIPGFYENRRPLVTKENFSEGFKERAYTWRGEAVILRNLDLKNKE